MPHFLISVFKQLGVPICTLPCCQTQLKKRQHKIATQTFCLLEMNPFYHDTDNLQV